jgi:membrane-associated phospholipid phosphatase
MLWGIRRWGNVLLAAYALAMGIVLVYTGEHFAFDILMGWIFAIAIALVAHHLAKRRPVFLTKLFHRSAPKPCPLDAAPSLPPAPADKAQDNA